MAEGIERSLLPAATISASPDSDDGPHRDAGEESGFTAWLRTAMVVRGLNVTDLARKSGVSRVAASAWLAGRSLPSGHSFVAIAAALELDPSTVLAAAGIHVVDDEQTVRIAELLGKVDQVRLTPERIVGLGGLLDAWIAADRVDSEETDGQSRFGSLDFVIRFVPPDGRASIDIERVGVGAAGRTRMQAAAAALGDRGESGEVRLVQVRGARLFGERIVAQATIAAPRREPSLRETGPPDGSSWTRFPPGIGRIEQTTAGPGESATTRIAEGSYVTAMHALAASDNDDQVYTLAEAARLKGVSYHTVSRAVRQGKLPHHRLGRMAFITAANLASWRPMVERAPKKYARRAPDPAAAPAMLDLASGDRVLLAQRFSILSEVLHAAAAGKPIGDLLDLLARRFAEALDLDRVTVWELDEGSGSVRKLAAFGHPRGVVPAEATPGEADAVRRMAGTASAAVLDGSEFVQPAGSFARASTLVVAPLRFGRRTHGLIVGDCAGGPFDLNQDQIAFAQAMANQAALSMQAAAAQRAAEPVAVR